MRTFIANKIESMVFLIQTELCKRKSTPLFSDSEELGELRKTVPIFTSRDRIPSYHIKNNHFNEKESLFHRHHYFKPVKPTRLP